jgi:hypothetical protein
MGQADMTIMNEQFAPARNDRGYSEDRMLVKLPFPGKKAGLHLFFTILGTALVLIAPGLWVLPGSSVSADVVMLKFGATLFFFLCGLALLMRNHLDALPEVYFDPIRREMRVLQKTKKGRPETVLRRSYDSLGAARITDRWLEIWDVDGTVLMRLPLRNPEVRSALRMQFSGLVRVTN